MYRDLQGTDANMSTVLCMGDVHLENYGVMEREDDSLIWSLNDFDESAWRIMNLGTDAALLDRQIQCSQTGVESWLLDNNRGTLATLVNWTNQPVLKDVRVSVKSSFAPREVFSVVGQKKLDFVYESGKAVFQMDLAEGDFVMLKK